MKYLKSCIASTILMSGLLAEANAEPIEATDFDSLDLGAKIVGPVGPDVEVSVINDSGDSIGDLRSSVSCPAGFAECLPPNTPAGTIYTYSHTLIPGVDLPNDEPFPMPGTLLPFDDVSEFSLGFAATGFNGIAGYSFSEAEDAGVEFTIEHFATGEISWTSNNSDWDTGEGITFFWQTSQAPSGPSGTYMIGNSNSSGVGAGPIPSAIAVSEPPTYAFLILGLLLAVRRFNCSKVA
ncbi:exosortase, PEP-CTERM interaction domain protein [Alteromonas lipotrueiana]|uniref:exosortase, PEP-CTERM interaction domain protein n=1 Tax=Alteromonas lipotrueiana TaxID=2803815 RepID=UPI001C45BB22|nr:exosortase, PEP-CTERM interaction domain protein [Alteromonas lipotrueiana]